MIQLNERITFNSSSSVSDGMGGRVQRWADGMTVWAMVEALRHGAYNSERIEAESSAPARCVYRIKIRTGIDFPRSQRISWRNKTMRILTRPITSQDKKWIEFYVVEVV